MLHQNVTGSRGNNHYFLCAGNNINSIFSSDYWRGERFFQEESTWGICISSDILQSRTDVKLANGNWAGWKQSRKRVADSGVRTLLQNTDVHVIIKLLHADTRSHYTHTQTDKPLYTGSWFLMLIEKIET